MCKLLRIPMVDDFRFDSMRFIPSYEDRRFYYVANFEIIVYMNMPFSLIFNTNVCDQDLVVRELQRIHSTWFPSINSSKDEDGNDSVYVPGVACESFVNCPSNVSDDFDILPPLCSNQL